MLELIIISIVTINNFWAPLWALQIRTKTYHLWSYYVPILLYEFHSVSSTIGTSLMCCKLDLSLLICSSPERIKEKKKKKWNQKGSDT